MMLGSPIRKVPTEFRSTDRTSEKIAEPKSEINRVRRSIDNQPLVTYEPLNQKALMKGTQRDDQPNSWISKKNFIRMSKEETLSKLSRSLLVSGKEEPYMEKKQSMQFR